MNVATDGEFFRQFTIVWTSGNQYLAQDNQGNEVYVTVAAGEPVTKENGRLILHAQGEEIDITEAMETAGAYHYAYDMDVVHEDGSRETGLSPLTSLATWTGGLCPRTTGTAPAMRLSAWRQRAYRVFRHHDRAGSRSLYRGPARCRREQRGRGKSTGDCPRQIEET